MMSMHKKTPYFFILPAYVVFLVFMFGPMVFSLVVSFFNWTGIKSPKFTGMENLKGVFTDPVFWLSVRIPCSIVR